jgi:hydroxymethylbilane synthase
VREVSQDLTAEAPNLLRLGTRGSLLARAQSQAIADDLVRLDPGVHVELIIVRTTGDQVQDRPLHEIGGKGLFTKELEQALLDGRIDFAVHSYKDLPITMPLVDQRNLVIAAVPKREVAFDAIVSTKARSIQELPQRAKVGTSSLRRRAQILELRPDVIVENIRGNIDTRIRKTLEGEFDATILAAAGLKRAGLFDPRVTQTITEILPAAGQAALAIQCRRDDARTRKLLAALGDPDSARAVDIERAIVAGLEGDCHSPIAAHATISGGERALLDVAVAARGGNLPVIRVRHEGRIAQIVDETIKQLLDLGADKLLRGN